MFIQCGAGFEPAVSPFFLSLVDLAQLDKILALTRTQCDSCESERVPITPPALENLSAYPVPLFPLRRCPAHVPDTIGHLVIAFFGIAEYCIDIPGPWPTSRNPLLPGGYVVSQSISGLHPDFVGDLHLHPPFIYPVRAGFEPTVTSPSRLIQVPLSQPLAPFLLRFPPRRPHWKF